MKDLINDDSARIYNKVLKCLMDETDKHTPQESFQATAMLVATILPYVVEELKGWQTEEQIKKTIMEIVEIGLRDEAKVDDNIILRRLS